MTDRNEMRQAAELVVGNPNSHTPAELALAGMLLELVDARVKFHEYDGTARFLRLDAGDPDAGIAPDYVVDEGEADAFKRINLRLVELEFAKAQCQKHHGDQSSTATALTALSVGAITAGTMIAGFSKRDQYWIDINGQKHTMSCRGGLSCTCSGVGPDWGRKTS